MEFRDSPISTGSLCLICVCLALAVPATDRSTLENRNGKMKINIP